MCVCVYVCMYMHALCMYVFMYVCVCVCMYVCVYVCMHVCMYVCVCKYVCVCMYVCTYVLCMYVCAGSEIRAHRGPWIGLPVFRGQQTVALFTGTSRTVGRLPIFHLCVTGEQLPSYCVPW
jgi:hypothetical protein